MTRDSAAQTVLTPDAAGYPEGLRRCLGEEAPGSVRVLGNTGVLGRDLLALFCSVRCPGDLILRTYDLAQALREQGVAVVGGFHSPMEQECLRILLRGPPPVVVCPARSIEGMRLPVAWRGPVEAGRLLVVSPFEEKAKRVTTELAERRNRFVAALAERVFISYAEPGARWRRWRGTSWGGGSRCSPSPARRTRRCSALAPGQWRTRASWQPRWRSGAAGASSLGGSYSGSGLGRGPCPYSRSWPAKAWRSLNRALVSW